MDEKSNKSSLRRYHFYIDEQDRNNNNNSSIDHLSSAATISHKRRRCSITNEQFLSTQVSSNNQDFIFDRNITMTTTRKRSAQDDIAAHTTHDFFREYDQHVRNECLVSSSFNYLAN
jgi:hypothetical protein